MSSTETLALPGVAGQPPAPSTRWPSVSVIVPTRNRAASLATLLAVLQAQVYPADRLEVIVVDNGSTDDTRAVTLAAAAAAPYPVRYERKANEGPAAARNRGAVLSRGEVLAFTDSDCLPSPGWLQRAISRLRPEDGLVCGPIVPIDPTGGSLLVHQIGQVDRDIGIYQTANVLYRRSAFVEAGGFDEQFGAYTWGPPVGGEDTDLAWRVRRAGHGAAFAPLAAVYHCATPISLGEYLASPVKAQILPRLLHAVPELRETFLWKRYFVGRHTAAFYPALLGLLLARRHPAALLLALPWLRTVWPLLAPQSWPPARWPRLALALGLVCQNALTLMLTLLAASLKHRKAVL